MKTKTFKLGEICRGGVITVEIKGNKIAVIAKDWDFSAGSSKSSNQSNAKEWDRLEVDVNDRSSEGEIDNFLNDLTTSYWADNILTWIKTKISFKSTPW